MNKVFEVLNIDEIKEVVKEGVYLKNPSHSIHYLGLGYIKSLADWVDENYKDIRFICDCDDDASLAYASIKLGFKCIIFKGEPEIYLKIQEIGVKVGARVISEI